MIAVRLNLKHLRAAFREDQIVISTGLSPEDNVANDRRTRSLIEHLAVMFLGVSEPGKLVYGLTGREQQSETKKRQITGHLLNLRIFERFRMQRRFNAPEACSGQASREQAYSASNGLGIRGVCVDSSRQQRRSLQNFHNSGTIYATRQKPADKAAGF